MNDLISRQDAIDAVQERIKQIGCENNVYVLSIIQVIREVPSAQPKRQWIPCSERLPEASGRYLISALDGIQTRTTVAPYQPRYKAWTMTGRMTYWKVIAWMPLPEPYKETEEWMI